MRGITPNRLGGPAGPITLRTTYRFLAVLILLACLSGLSAARAQERRPNGETLAGLPIEWPPLELSLSGRSANGLFTIQIDLHNRSRAVLSDVTVIGTVPEGATFLNAEMISAANPGQFDGSIVQFHVEHLRAGATLGPLVYRFKAGPELRAARVHSWAVWTRPAIGTAVSADLSLAVLTYLGRSIPSSSALTTHLNALLAPAHLQDNRAGAIVYDLKVGQPLFERDAQELFVPASNAKLLVAAAALDALTPTYRFKTALLADSFITSTGAISGHLYVQGFGDPTLTTDTVSRWAAQLTEAGLKSVNGDLLVDATFFAPESQPVPAPEEGSEVAAYPPQVGALSVNQNCVAVIVGPGPAPGKQADVRKDPSTRFLRLYNAATTSANGRAAIRIRRDPASGQWRIEGQVPAGSRPVRYDVPVDEPGLHAGELLKRALIERGVAFTGTGAVRYGAPPEGAITLGVYWSAPLEDILARMLKDSDNFISEQLLRTLGHEVQGIGSAAAGQQVIARFLHANGLVRGYSLYDACGLSTRDRVSPELLGGLLVLMDAHPYGQAFRNALAIAGADGTLATRLKAINGTGGLVQAKTGSLPVASTLSGYITTPAGREFVFSILMNTPAELGWARIEALRNLQDQMVLALLRDGQ